MDLQRAVNITQENILFSDLFPFRTGNLRNNFFDATKPISENSIGFSVMSSQKLIVGKNNVNYGKLLETAPSIRYGLKKNGVVYNYVRYDNRHYKFIERIIEKDVIPAIEYDLGVKLV